ncbi:hypothetical protein MKQ70_37145 [Chitinophaga sedimenti]|uniref:hypothetical protein n=1 Tax=Chitinophaga sedimenti TaxID=2033606 RepID=UPI00200669E3|nr:hypothetical protein [Chitinophaga sedimenti]MCK7560237.1 hypothetical protein [Chitinophaga sedimenti]
MNISNLLSQLEQHLHTSVTEVAHRLQPGLPANHIDELFRSIDICVPESIFLLYQWKNGVLQSNDNIIYGELFSNGIFYDLATAIAVYVVNSVENNYVDKRFFPLFTSGGGDYVMIALDEVVDGDASLYLYSPALNLSAIPVPIYSSIAKMLQAIFLCYQAGAYYFKDRELVINHELEGRISGSINPDAPFWQEGSKL